MLNERLKNLRLSKGLTLQQVGDHFGISVASVANWENGKSQPDSRKLSRLADLFGCTLEFLLSGKSDTHQQEQQGQVFASVPFVSWTQIVTKQIRFDSSLRSTPLHVELSESGFATRYPGSINFNWYQGPVPAGAMIFIDPEKDLKINSLALIIDDNSSLSITKVQMQSKPSGHYLSPFNSSQTLIKSTDVEVIGSIVEWRLSGIL